MPRENKENAPLKKKKVSQKRPLKAKDSPETKESSMNKFGQGKFKKIFDELYEDSLKIDNTSVKKSLHNLIEEKKRKDLQSTDE